MNRSLTQSIIKMLTLLVGVLALGLGWGNALTVYAEGAPWVSVATGSCQNPSYTTDIPAGQTMLLVSGNLMAGSPFNYSVTAYGIASRPPWWSTGQTVYADSSGLVCVDAFGTASDDYGMFLVSVHGLGADQIQYNPGAMGFTVVGTLVPTETPTNVPTEEPTVAPTIAPTQIPTVAPTLAPTESPTVVPSTTPVPVATVVPTPIPAEPTNVPSSNPEMISTEVPEVIATAMPTDHPTAMPTQNGLRITNVASTSTPEPTQTTPQPTLEPGVLVIAQANIVTETSAQAAEVSSTQTTVYALPTVEAVSVNAKIIPATGQNVSARVTVERVGEWLSGLVAAIAFFWFAALLYRHLS